MTALVTCALAVGASPAAIRRRAASLTSAAAAALSLRKESESAVCMYAGAAPAKSSVRPREGDIGGGCSACPIEYACRKVQAAAGLNWRLLRCLYDEVGVSPSSRKRGCERGGAGASHPVGHTSARSTVSCESSSCCSDCSSSPDPRGAGIRAANLPRRCAREGLLWLWSGCGRGSSPASSGAGASPSAVSGSGATTGRRRREGLGAASALGVSNCSAMA